MVQRLPPARSLKRLPLNARDCKVCSLSTIRPPAISSDLSPPQLVGHLRVYVLGYFFTQHPESACRCVDHNELAAVVLLLDPRLACHSKLLQSGHQQIHLICGETVSTESCVAVISLVFVFGPENVIPVIHVPHCDGAPVEGLRHLFRDPFGGSKGKGGQKRTCTKPNGRFLGVSVSGNLFKVVTIQHLRHPLCILPLALSVDNSQSNFTTVDANTPIP